MAYHRANLTDYKRNNCVKCRNFSETQDFHDIVKTLLVRMIRRKHQDNRDPIYTEHDGNEPNESYPDVWFKITRSSKANPGVDIYVYEIQRDITKQWKAQIEKKHADVNLIIIPLNEIEERWDNKIIKGNHGLDELKKILEEYVI